MKKIIIIAIIIAVLSAVTISYAAKEYDFSTDTNHTLFIEKTTDSYSQVYLDDPLQKTIITKGASISFDSDNDGSADIRVTLTDIINKNPLIKIEAIQEKPDNLITSGAISDLTNGQNSESLALIVITVMITVTLLVGFELAVLSKEEFVHKDLDDTDRENLAIYYNLPEHVIQQGLDYVNACKQQGFQETQIRSALLDKDWPEDVVNFFLRN